MHYIEARLIILRTLTPTSWKHITGTLPYLLRSNNSKTSKRNRVIYYSIWPTVKWRQCIIKPGVINRPPLFRPDSGNTAPEQAGIDTRTVGTNSPITLHITAWSGLLCSGTEYRVSRRYKTMSETITVTVCTMLSGQHKRVAFSGNIRVNSCSNQVVKLQF